MHLTSIQVTIAVSAVLMGVLSVCVAAMLLQWLPPSRPAPVAPAVAAAAAPTHASSAPARWGAASLWAASGPSWGPTRWVGGAMCVGHTLLVGAWVGGAMGGTEARLFLSKSRGVTYSFAKGGGLAEEMHGCWSGGAW